jgi:cytochrome c553
MKSNLYAFTARAVLITASVATLATIPAFAADPPTWAYGVPPGTPMPGAAPAAPAPAAAPAPDPTKKKLAGSTLEFTAAEIRNGFGPADWFPGDHPQMPPIVANGKRPDAIACSLCHYPNGKGRPENAGVAGLSTSYFLQTMNDFRNGTRKSAEPRKGNTNVMIRIAKALNEEELKASAEYFASMKWTPWIKVQETAMVPKTRLAGGMYLPLEGNEKEAIGTRIIETPEDPETTEGMRNPRSGFIAYVPMGAVKKGEAIAKARQCATCHGPDLKGLGPVPPLAGRSPSYMGRQITDFQNGARVGEWSALMKNAVANLSDADLVSLCAYLASLKP